MDQFLDAAENIGRLHDGRASDGAVGVLGLPVLYPHPAGPDALPCPQDQPACADATFISLSRLSLDRDAHDARSLYGITSEPRGAGKWCRTFCDNLLYGG